MTEAHLTRHTDAIRDAVLEAERQVAMTELAAALALTGVEYKGQSVQTIDSSVGAQIVASPQSEEGVGK